MGLPTVAVLEEEIRDGSNSAATISGHTNGDGSLSIVVAFVRARRTKVHPLHYSLRL